MKTARGSNKWLERFGWHLIETSIALFIIYFVLPRLADEYDYRTRLYGFLQQVGAVRAEIDQRLGKVPPEDRENLAREAGDRLGNIVAKLTSKYNSSSKVKGITVPKKRTGRLIRIPGVDPEDVVWIAKRWIGSRYVWGGTSRRRGTDCSGFTQSVFGTLGVHLPRTVVGQFGRGLYVPRSQLQPGDLVFFSTYKAGPSHVGIFCGDDKFVHASSGTGRVRIDSLDDNYFHRRYLGARRILTYS